MSTRPSSAIGVFDSGIGGLTVVKSIRHSLPEEHIVYFGDTARVPYGIKSTETVREYALQITDFLLSRDVKMIVIACNTVSAAAETQVRQRATPIPVIGVVEGGGGGSIIEGARVAVQHAGPDGSVGIIGTLATVASGTYETSIHAIQPGLKVHSTACPLLVPLAEEGWLDNDVAMLTLRHYLSEFDGQPLDALILGCTHYPLFKESIRTILPETVTIIDSADAVAAQVDETLRASGMRRLDGSGSLECVVSDKPQRFQTLAERFLGRPVDRIDVVSVA
jgi:glutamate racemase